MAAPTRSTAADEPIRDVSDTALWVAIYRAQESERKDALFLDPYARRLAGERGQRIVDSVPQGRAWSWPMVVRTKCFDDIVLQSLRDEGFDTVLNLAAGLDARPWRLDLPRETRWIDVDMPAMLAYKQHAMAGETPRCRYTARAADLREADARRTLFGEVNAHAKRVLVMSEGLLIYLEPHEVAALAEDLARQPAFERSRHVDAQGFSLIQQPAADRDVRGPPIDLIHWRPPSRTPSAHAARPRRPPRRVCGGGRRRGTDRGCWSWRNPSARRAGGARWLTASRIGAMTGPCAMEQPGPPSC